MPAKKGREKRKEPGDGAVAMDGSVLGDKVYRPGLS